MLFRSPNNFFFIYILKNININFLIINIYLRRSASKPIVHEEMLGSNIPPKFLSNLCPQCSKFYGSELFSLGLQTIK